MAAITANRPNVTSGDRLSLTIFFAVVMHSLIILGISFDAADRSQPLQKLPGLEVTLVQSKTDKMQTSWPRLTRKEAVIRKKKSDQLRRSHRMLLPAKPVT
jgi:hypothetical protein